MAKKCNERFIHTIISGTTFIKPQIIYECCLANNPNEIATPPVDECIVLQTRWVRNPNLDYCQVEEGFNTGILFKYEYQEEQIDSNSWYTNGNTRFTPEYNTIACPLIFYRMAMYVGLTYDLNEEVDIPYSLSLISTETPIRAGYNYLFLSIPAGKSFLIKDSSGFDITYLFTYIQDDIREGFRNNKIYRKNPKYFSELPLPFTILIY